MLKGGTALNLMIFNLPRLSVDIDMDFHSSADRNTALEERKVVGEIFVEYKKSSDGNLEDNEYFKEQVIKLRIA